MSDEASSTLVDEPAEGPDGPQSAEPVNKRKHNPVVEWIIVVAVAIGFALLLKTFVVEQFQVDGHSMDSTLHNGDRVLVNKLSYRLHDPHRGDVVVLKRLDGPTGGERDLIKRVIGLPGDHVVVKNCVVTVDGRVLEEPYLDPQVVSSGNCGKDADVEVPGGRVFVMGDNRGGSMDSRDIGPIPEGDLIGRAFVIIWPIGDWEWL